MGLWSNIEELEPKEKAFQVFHRRLKIPKEAYQEAMANFPQPYKEEGYQDFVARYLQDKGDPGIVGMVRVEELDQDLVLDAAVRYPAENEAGEINYFWSS